MRRSVLLCLVTSIGVWAQQVSIGLAAQKHTCTVADGTGNVTINCPGLDPAVVRVLSEQLGAQLKEREWRIDQITKEANDWKDGFLDLLTRLADAGVNDGLHLRAENLLKEGKLDEAGKVLDELIAGEENKVDQLAKDHFSRASLYQLQFRPLEALPHYQKAQSYYQQRDFGKAESICKALLEIRRALAKAKPEAYLPEVAATLNNLAVLYSATHRQKEAAEAYSEALQTYRALAKAKPQAYLPEVAGMLNNLGNSYRETQRLREAAEAYAEALQVRRSLAKENPQAYLPDVASSLNNLGVLYRAMDRPEEAAQAYTDALETNRELAKANPQAYLPGVATTLNNLGNLYGGTQRLKEAAEAYTEALQIRRELAKANPQAYLPGVANTLNNLAGLYSATQRTKESAEAYTEALQIRRGLATANPQAYLPDVATTLNNLGVLYKSEGQNTEAAPFCSEAAAILKQLAVDNPARHGPELSSLCATGFELAPRAPGQSVSAGAARENPKSEGVAPILAPDGMKYAWIPPGTFQMGCSPGDHECHDEEKPSHEVTISKGFWIGQTPVTVGAYKRFARTTGRTMPPVPNLLGRVLNDGWSKEAMPLVAVTWGEARDYCTWVRGRLPTEAEWEYAARGGSREARYGPLDEVAWIADNSGLQRLDSAQIWKDDQKNYGQRLRDNGNGMHEVAQKRPNGFGLYDVLGNVFEWVSDWFDVAYYSNSSTVDPSGPSSRKERALRGGAWNFNPSYARVSNRVGLDPDIRSAFLGFRCVFGP